MMRTPILLLATACVVLAGCTQPASMTDGGAEDPNTSPNDGTIPIDNTPGSAQDNVSEETFQGKIGSLTISRHNPDGTGNSRILTVLEDPDDDFKVQSGATKIMAQAEWTPAVPTTEWRFCLGINGKIPDGFCVIGSQNPLELTLPPEGTNLTTGTYDLLFSVAEHEVAPANAGAAVEITWEATVTYGKTD